MSDLGFVLRELQGLPVADRVIFTRIFTDVLKNMRIGHPIGTQPDPLTNFAGGFFAATTASVANTEFSIQHGFGRVPYLLHPVLPLDQLNAQIVPLKVTRVADDKRVYLSSSVVSASITVAVEG